MFLKKKIYIFIYILSVILLATCSEKNTIKNEKEVVLRLEPGPGNPRNSEGDFIQLNDGRILFIYTHFTSGSGDNSGAFLAGRYSEDKGKIWSKNDVTILPNEGGMNIMSVSLIRLENGQIALFYLRKNAADDCIPIMRTSSDEADTWSEPKECVDIPGYYVMNNDRVVKLRNGRIILPLALHRTPGDDGSDIGRIMCYYSDDEGKTWVKSEEIENPNNVKSQEPGVIELKDGRLMLFCRTDSGVQYISFSTDMGTTWSALKPSNIKSPLSPASIERIPQTGDLMLVWNNNYKKGRDGGKRTPFNLAVSKDDGNTWEKIKTIESDPDGWYCYTAIEFIGNEVLLGHCAGDTKKTSGLATTQITRISLDWIYKNATPDPYVKLDENGIIELTCSDSDAKIYYTIDGSYPSVETNKIYTKQFVVKVTTPLMMFAISKDNTQSNLVIDYVGENVYQAAMDSLRISSNGLNYKYYDVSIKNTSELEKYSATESGIIPNFSIANSKKDKKFAFVYNGFIKIDKDGLYTFYLKSNDGSTLYINDYKIINNDGKHGVFEEVSSISLRQGLHKIKLKYFQAGGGKLLKVMWKSPEFEKTEIQESVLFH